MRPRLLRALLIMSRYQLRMGAPKLMEPLLNVPSADFEFAMKIRVRGRLGGCGGGGLGEIVGAGEGQG